MEEQLMQPAVAPAKEKNPLPVIIIVNAVITVLVAAAVSFLVVASATKPLTGKITALESVTSKQADRITVLEQQLAKISSVYHVGK
jgi:hypothetical protein